VSGWRKRQIVDAMSNTQKTCQVCRVRPAIKQVKRQDGIPQWKCQTCLDLKNRPGFTKGKQ
jgi:ribosomal protein L37AE/L43A